LTSKNGISGFFLMATGQIESADVSYKTNEFISLRFSSNVDIVSFIS
jgi:hypothetical protein